MTAGLPGTGIGGLFYLLLVFWMPCREIYLLCRGRSSLARWRAIAFFMSMTLAIIVTTYAEAWILSKVVTSIATAIGTLPPGQGQGYKLLAGASIVMSLGSLVVVLLGVHVLRLVLRWRNRPRQAIRAIAGLLPDRPLQPGRAA